MGGARESTSSHEPVMSSEASSYLRVSVHFRRVVCGCVASERRGVLWSSAVVGQRGLGAHEAESVLRSPRSASRFVLGVSFSVCRCEGVSLRTGVDARARGGGGECAYNTLARMKPRASRSCPARPEVSFLVQRVVHGVTVLGVPFRTGVKTVCEYSTVGANEARQSFLVSLPAPPGVSFSASCPRCPRCWCFVAHRCESARAGSEWGYNTVARTKLRASCGRPAPPGGCCPCRRPPRCTRAARPRGRRHAGSAPEKKLGAG